MIFYLVLVLEEFSGETYTLPKLTV